jgi:hypothetical protein
LLTVNVMLFVASAIHIFRTTAASRPAMRSSNHGQLLVRKQFQRSSQIIADNSVDLRSLDC